MLPDYPKAKAEIDRLIFTAFAHGRDPLLLGIKSAPIHEGNRGRITRPDGSQEEIAFQRHSATIEFREDEYEHLTWNDVMQRVVGAGQEMGISMSRQMVEKFDAVTKETGNRMDIQGTLTPEKLFFLLSKMDMPFNDDGQPEWLTFFAGKVASKAIEAVLKEIDSSPELGNEMKSLISKKREQWSDSESHRKLVG